jgi:hypothetical protein
LNVHGDQLLGNLAPHTPNITDRNRCEQLADLCGTVASKIAHPIPARISLLGAMVRQLRKRLGIGNADTNRNADVLFDGFADGLTISDK